MPSVPARAARRTPGAHPTRAPTALTNGPSAAVTPFLKWAGGKRQLLAQIARRLPAGFGRYHEPFLGGGAVFFFLSPSLRGKRAWLADSNERLVRTYRGLQTDPDGVIRLLRTYPHARSFFLELRGQPIDERSDVEVAAWMIYLNRTAYNGLYRVNSRNLFNVPFGDYARPTICDERLLRACSAALARAKVEKLDFEAAARRAEPGDLVYFDPPYVPRSPSASFTAYTSGGFGLHDQQRLRDLALELKGGGVHVLLSNSAAPAVRALYRDGFRVERVLATRAINSRTDRRGPVAELLIR